MKQYIIFEGVDFTGKTTLATMLYNHLCGYKNVLFTKEPGSPHSETCKQIRQVILNSKGMTDLSYALLFSADANEHLNAIVKPALDRGQVVISDRAMISDYAYRPQIDYDIKKQNFELMKSLKPLVLYYTCSMEEIRKRIKERCVDTPLLEFEKLVVIDRIQEIDENYLSFLYKSGLDFVIIDTTGETVEQSFQTLLGYLGEL